eukprot:g356.t1
MQKFLLLIPFSIVNASSHPHRELSSSAAIDAILENDPTNYMEVEVPAVPRWDVPLDGAHWLEDDFEETSFLMLSEKVFSTQKNKLMHKDPAQTKSLGVDTFGENAPIQCETVCRPLEDNETDKALDASTPSPKAQDASTPSPSETNTTVSGGERTSSSSQENLIQRGNISEEKASDNDEISFLQLSLSKQMCELKSGGWNHDTKECDPFMKATEVKLSYEPKAIFNICQQEHGKLYVPCNPYQALALAHIYDVPDHSYYWLWPGGRHNQVGNAAMKQDFGNNPTSGMDTCPDEQHVGFFHNWDEAHVDSWGCLHESQEMPVLCCRRG